MKKELKKPTTEKKAPKALAVYGKDRLEQNARVGMKGVDPMDIRPPQILLAQALSDFDQLTDQDGKQAKIGQFFHTGKLKIYNSFECYFLFAAKSKYINRRKPEKGELDQYKVLGVMVDGLSLFAMTFRSSSLYTLSPLFGMATSRKRPMYSFVCEIKTKMLSGEKGDWFIPVLRIKSPEKNPEKLVLLEEQARKFDLRTEEFTEKDLDAIDKGTEKKNPNGPVPF